MVFIQNKSNHAMLFYIAIWGVLAVERVLSIIPGSCWLKAEEQGFVFCSQFVQLRFMWEDVEGFRPSKFFGVVVFTHKSKPNRIRFFGAFIEKMRFLPALYGLPIQDLADFMNNQKSAWQKQQASS